MPFWTVVFAAAGSKSFISLSVFFLKYFNISVVVAYLGSSWLGLFTSSVWLKVRKENKIPLNIWCANSMRCLLRDAALLGVFYGFMHGSIPRVSAIFFSTSFLLPIFGRIFLKLKTPPTQWLFLILGYIGLMIILRPFSCTQDNGTLDVIVLCATCGLALSNTTLKYLMGKGMRISESIFISSVFRVVASTIFLFIFFDDVAHNISDFEGRYITLIVIIVFCALWQNAAQALHTYTFRWGRLPLLAIMELWRFVYDACVGYFLFNHVLGIHESWGVLVIAVAIVGMSVVNWRAVKQDRILKKSVKNEKNTT